jgi:hypothetical protein
MARATLVVAGFLIIVASGLIGLSSFATALAGGRIETGPLFLASCGLFLGGLCLAIFGIFAPSELERAQLESMQHAVSPMYHTVQASQQTYVQEREIVKVRCRNSGSLNLETANACESCGAPM